MGLYHSNRIVIVYTEQIKSKQEWKRKKAAMKFDIHFYLIRASFYFGLETTLILFLSLHLDNRKLF